MKVSTVILIGVLSYILFKLYLRKEDAVGTTSPKSGTIIVSSARGSGRDIALRLGDAGFHVVIGVESNAEAKSFKYTTFKGI